MLILKSLLLLRVLAGGRATIFNTGVHNSIKYFFFLVKDLFRIELVGNGMLGFLKPEKSFFSKERFFILENRMTNTSLSKKVQQSVCCWQNNWIEFIQKQFSQMENSLLSWQTTVGMQFSKESTTEHGIENVLSWLSLFTANFHLWFMLHGRFHFNMAKLFVKAYLGRNDFRKFWEINSAWPDSSVCYAIRKGWERLFRKRS